MISPASHDDQVGLMVDMVDISIWVNYISPTCKTTIKGDNSPVHSPLFHWGRDEIYPDGAEYRIGYAMRCLMGRPTRYEVGLKMMDTSQALGGVPYFQTNPRATMSQLVGNCSSNICAMWFEKKLEHLIQPWDIHRDLILFFTCTVWHGRADGAFPVNVDIIQLGKDCHQILEVFLSCLTRE